MERESIERTLRVPLQFTDVQQYFERIPLLETVTITGIQVLSDEDSEIIPAHPGFTLPPDGLLQDFTLALYDRWGRCVSPECTSYQYYRNKLLGPIIRDAFTSVHWDGLDLRLSYVRDVGGYGSFLDWAMLIRYRE